MQQQSRRTETNSKSRTARQDHRKNQPLREGGAVPVQVGLDVLRAGGSLEQLPVETIMELVSRMGNSAVLSLLSRRESAPAPPVRFPETLDTEPLPVPEQAPELTPGPDFGAMALPETAALSL